MSPEQVMGQRDQIGPHSDIWALGVILYEMLSGVNPFRGESQTSTLHRVLKFDVPSLSLNSNIPPRLACICGRCLERNVAERYRNVGEFSADLTRWQGPIHKKQPIEDGMELDSLVREKAPQRKKDDQQTNVINFIPEVIAYNPISEPKIRKSTANLSVITAAQKMLIKFRQ
jgi:serine/threonine protein kinase